MTVPAPRTVTNLDVSTLVRETVRVTPSYLPATLTENESGRVIKLDMNESPYGPSPMARATIARFAQTHRYPDFAQQALREAIGAYVGAPATRIICGAGLDDVLNTLMHTLLDPGDEVVISEPTFGVYRSQATLYGANTINVSLQPGFALDADGVLAAISPATKLVIICSPNNPTGNLLDPGAIRTIVDSAQCLVAIDEAYAEFAGVTNLPLAISHPNVAILRTLSKFAGLAGMRVGYGIFPDALMPHLLTVAPPFHNVSLVSGEAAIASLQDLDHLRVVVDRIVSDRETLAERLSELPGVTPLPSATNFLLVRLPVPSAAPVVARLAAHGVFVRHFGNPALGLQDCLRVTIGTAEENTIFLTELTRALNMERSA